MSKRRGNGEGTISQRKDGLWIGQVTLYIDENGKQVRKCVSAKTKREVSDKIAQLTVSKNTNSIAKPNKTTLEIWITEWLCTYKKRNLKKKTFANYQSAINHHIIKNIGKIPLQKLSHIDVQRFINKLTDDGVAPSTIKYVFTVLSSSLNQAVKNKMIDNNNNPCDSIQLPTIPRSTIETFTIEQVKKFLNTAKEHYLYTSFLLLATTGIRRGECLALRWEDIDFNQKTIHIDRQIISSSIDGNFIEETPKTENSLRTIPLPQSIIDILTPFKKESGWLASTRNKTFVSPRNLNRAYYMLLERAELPKLKLHGLRHTVGTLLIESGCDLKSTSNLLGHSSPLFTAKTYVHPGMAMKEHAIERIADLFFK